MKHHACSLSRKGTGEDNENKPLLLQKLPQKGSYGGQSASGASNSSSQGVNVEVDYGEPNFGVMGGTAKEEVDTSWAVDYGTHDRTEFSKTEEDASSSDEDESSSDEDEDDFNSSHAESSNDDESDASEPPRKEWHDEEQNMRKKKMITKRKKRTNWQEDEKKRSKTRKKVKDDESNTNDDIETLHRPRRSCCHSFFIVIQIAAILANLTMIAFQVSELFLPSFIFAEDTQF